MLNSILPFGLILFELGHRVSGVPRNEARRRLLAGLGVALAAGLPILAIGARHLGLPPLSSVVPVLLANTQVLYSGMDPTLVGMLLATILLMQLLGPFATQTAIKGFGEATRLLAGRYGAGAAGTHGGAAS